MIKEISSHIRDVARSLSPQTKLVLEINEEPANDLLCVSIAMDKEPAAGPAKPIPMPTLIFGQVCDLCGGCLTMDSLNVYATMRYSHQNRPPMGDMPSVISELMIESDLYYTHRYNGRTYQLSAAYVKSALDGVPLDTPSVSQWVKERVADGLWEISRSEAFV